ncbi:Anoctamin-6 [Nymphon striatum]|nr:Anoctamin-6 [Nymphon striatum]
MNPCDEEQPVDFVLVYPVKPDYFEDEDDLQKWRTKERLRVLFEDAAFREGLKCSEERIGKNVFVKIHCPFDRLCRQAERIKLEMPLKVETGDTEEKESAAKVLSMLFKINQKPSRYLSAPFRVLIADQFLGYEYPDMFFRSALRSLLAEHILNRINIQDKLADSEIEAARTKGLAYMLMKKAFTDYLTFHDKTRRSDSRRTSAVLIDDDDNEDSVSPDRKLSMISEISNIEDHFDFGMQEKGPIDTRAQLAKTWNRFFKPQPMWLIRNYFGEKIAFYFAWEGTLISSLIFPAILGIIIFGIGVPVAIEQFEDDNKHQIPQACTEPVGDEHPVLDENIIKSLIIKLSKCDSPGPDGLITQTLWIFKPALLNNPVGFILNKCLCLVFPFSIVIKEVDFPPVRASAYISYYLEVVKIACDNKLTPWFAFIICLWGTIFLEIWKRVRATQSFRWGVDHFHETEPVRPEFRPTHVRHDPVLNTSEMYYPMYYRLAKYVASACISFLMIFVVLISVTMVIVFRLYVVNDYCPNSEVCQFTLATLAPALMNTISILILGKLFAASFPLAPLIALVTMTIDMRIDATRLLFWNRRPIAYRHHGIGIWFEIIRFVNLCGVVTNGLLITFTSSYGKSENIEWKLVFFIFFEEKSLVTESLIEGMKHNYEKKLKGYKDNNDSPPNSPKNSPKSKHRFAEKYKHLYKRLD